MAQGNCKLLCIAALLAAFSVSARAQQFFSTPVGNERGTLRWQSLETQDYSLLYPAGLDSLGKVYAALLQQYQPTVGLSVGYAPNEAYRGPMPVVLHPYTAEAMGQVYWAPRRVDLNTVPDPFGRFSPLPWETFLAIHNSRSVAQQQMGHSAFWTGFHYALGDAVTKLINTLSDRSELEGDAVVMETALTRSGRGRTADFLAYHRMAFDQGDRRSWDRWRFGSMKYYTPDPNRVGYMAVSGFRYLYNEPMYMRRMQDRYSHPWRLLTEPGLSRQISGKRFNDAWDEIIGTFHALWAADDSLRAPFQEVMPATDTPDVFTTISGAVEVDEGRVWAVRTAMDRPAELVEIHPFGELKVLRPFAGESKLAVSPVRSLIYWSETVPSLRWEYESESRIYKMRTEPGASPVALTRGGRFFNPAVSATGDTLVVVDYPVAGGSALVLLDASSGRETARMKAPAGLQFTEAVFRGREIIAAGISAEGSALYRVHPGGLSALMKPTPVKIKDLRSYPEGIYFTSDRTGTNEIYCLDPAKGSFRRLTNTRYGVSEPFLVSGSLAFSALTREGALLSRADDRFSEEVDFQEHVAYPIADCLSAQEDSLRASVSAAPVQTGSLAPWKKLPHAFHFHTWLPLYYNLDGFNATETSYLYQTASFGALGFFQNLTGTLDGTLGLSLHSDPFHPGRIAPGFHGRLHYKGWYPRLDLALDAGERAPALLFWDDEDRQIVAYPQKEATPGFYIGGAASLSLPLNFSSNGWQRFLTPALTLGGSTDINSWTNGLELREIRRLFAEASLKGEVHLGTAVSQVYPRWGIGALVKGRISTDARVLFGQGWLYLPGITRTQGLKLTGAMQFRQLQVPGSYYPFDFGAEDIAPRGYVRTMVPSLLAQLSHVAARASVDYAIPLFALDQSLFSLFYLRNLELVPFVDATAFLSRQSLGVRRRHQILFSAGSDIVIRFEKLVLLTFPIKMGVRLAYNGGFCYDYFKEAAGLRSPVYAGFLFNTNF